MRRHRRKNSQASYLPSESSPPNTRKSPPTHAPSRRSESEAETPTPAPDPEQEQPLPWLWLLLLLLLLKSPALALLSPRLS